MASENSLFSQISTLIKNGKNFSPQGKIGSAAVKWGKRATAGMGLVALGILAYFYKLGMAAFKGAIVGATVGGVAGAGFGGFLGFQLGVALAPFTFGLSIPVFTVLGASLGGATGAAIGALAGGLIGYGLASGSSTAVSMGVGASTGGVVGGYLGFTAGTIVASTFTTLAIAACVATAIGCVLIPIAAISSPIIIGVSTALGAVGGAAVGAAAGYAVGKYLLEPAKNAYLNSVQGIKGFFQSSSTQGEYVGPGASQTGGGLQPITGGALSTAGNFITGALAGAWNTAVGWVGNTLSFGGSLISKGLGILSSGTVSAEVATVCKVAVGGACGTIATVSILSSISTNTAFSTSEGEIINTGPSSNQLFTVAKTVDQPTIGNLGGSVVFTITIEAKKNMVAITVTDTLTRKSGATNPTVSCPLPFSAPSVCTQTVPLTVNTSDADSVINNSVTVNATADDGTTATGSASATVTVGSAPPTAGCFNFSGPWSASEIDIEKQAIARISQSPFYINLLCAGGKTIDIIREPGGGYNHASCPNDVYISDIGIGSLNQTSYTLAHETGHIVQICTHPEIYQGYLNQAPYASEGFICSYPYSAILGSDQSTWPSESFAEMIGIYVAWRNFPTDLCGQINYPTQYPAQYNFAKNNLFGGTQF